MDKKKIEELEKEEESLLDVQINYYRLMFNKLREIKSLNKNYKLAKKMAALYLDSNEDHQNVYDQEKEALKYCAKNLRKIKQIDEELKIVKPLLICKTEIINLSLKDTYKNEELEEEVNDIELLIDMTTDECKNECLVEYQLLKKQNEENKKIINDLKK